MSKEISKLDCLKLNLKQGECKFYYFDLEPYTDRDWRLINVRDSEKAAVSSIGINFSSHSSQSEMMYEKCSLLIRLPTVKGEDDWRFTSGGIEYVENSSSDGFQDLSTELAPDSKTLCISVSDMTRGEAHNNAKIEFRFVASLRKKDENIKHIYVSQDPAISVDRGEG